MRLVSPAPVIVPQGAPRPQAPPTIYQPPQPQATQQNIYSTHNNTSVGGKRTFFVLSFYFILASVNNFICCKLALNYR